MCRLSTKIIFCLMAVTYQAASAGDRKPTAAESRAFQERLINSTQLVQGMNFGELPPCAIATVDGEKSFLGWAGQQVALHDPNTYSIIPNSAPGLIGIRDLMIPATPGGVPLYHLEYRTRAQLLNSQLPEGGVNGVVIRKAQFISYGGQAYRSLTPKSPLDIALPTVRRLEQCRGSAHLSVVSRWISTSPAGCQEELASIS